MGRIGRLMILVISLLCLNSCGWNKVKGTSLEKKDSQNVSQSKIKSDEEKQKNVHQIIKPTKKQQVEQLIQSMSIEEKIGQLFIIDVRQDAMGNPNTTISSDIEDIISKYKVGGIVLFKENIQEKEQTKELIKALQQVANIPLWISVDEEGGKVSRVGKNPNMVQEPFIEAATLGKSKDAEKAYKEGKRMGKVLYELGFNMDFAPVADIWSNPENTVIGTRSFGKTAEEVTPMVIQFAKGLQEEKIMPIIKHFPGHGNTKEDSHEGFAYSHKSLEELEKEEMIPFKKGIEAGIEAMMIGHLLVKDVDKTYPATLSKLWGEYIEQNFNTEEVLLITDAMNMGAIANYYGAEEASLRSVLSGYDLILMPADLEAAYENLLLAYRQGKLTKERIDKSVKKILLKKVEHNLLVLE